MRREKANFRAEADSVLFYLKRCLSQSPKEDGEEKGAA